MGVRTRIAGTLTRAAKALGTDVETLAGPGPEAMHQAAAGVSQMGPDHPFSPGEPVGPYDGYSRTPRVLDYTTSYNVATRPRTHERVSFDALKGLIGAYDVADICIWHRIDSIRSLKWKLIATQGYTGDVTGAIALAQKALKKPDRKQSFKAWFAKYAYDILAYDAGALYRMRNRAGQCIGLKPVDGTLIAPLLDYWGDSPEPPAEAYVQYANGLPWGWLTRDDLIYEPFRPHSDSPYGHAPIESIMLNANTDIRFQIYFLQRFTEGNIPEAFASAPESWNPDQIETFQAYWDSMIYGDQAAKHQIRWLPGGSQFTWSNEKEFTDTFSLFLMRKTCASFHVVPSDLGFTEDVNRSSGESQADVQHRVGDLPLMEHIEGILSAFIIDDLGLPLEFEFDRGEEQDDQLNVAQSDQIYIQNGVVGASEIREMRFGLAEPEGQTVPRVFFTTRGGPIPLSALYGVAGPVDAQTAAPDPDAPLPHEAFTGVQGVLPNPPLVAEPLAEQEYGPKALPPAPPPQPGTVAKEAGEGGTPTTGITADTGITSYDLIGQDDDEDGPEDQAAVVKSELAAFRRFEKARRKAGTWRDFEFRHVDAAEAAQLNAAARVKVRKDTSGYDLGPRSGMISLDLPEGLIDPVPGGVTDHHITIVYLGPDVDEVALMQACERAGTAAAAMPGPLTGTVGGIGTFPPSDSSDGKTPAWAGVVLPGAEQLRESLADLSASEHADWHPHVTLAYTEPGDPLPAAVPETPVTFTHLSVHCGNDVGRFPLGAAEVTKAASPPKVWPGWEHDGPAVAYWAPQVTAAVSRALTPAVLDRMAMSYLAANPAQQGDAPGKRDRNGAAAAWLAEWLAASGITLPLAAVAEGIVTGGYLIGAVSATALVNGHDRVVQAAPPGDTQGAVRQVASLGLDAALSAFLAGAVAAAVTAITGAFTAVLSRVLGGVTGGTSMRDLGDQLAGAVAAPDVAEGAAMDQVTGASAQAAMDTYPENGVEYSLWLTDPAAGIVCPVCLDNEAEGRVPLGQPFSSGDTMPPAHPRCNCSLIPG
jgi:2'-5' RNA ligase